jgi:hypothetical protein
MSVVNVSIGGRAPAVCHHSVRRYSGTALFIMLAD